MGMLFKCPTVLDRAEALSTIKSRLTQDGYIHVNRVLNLIGEAQEMDYYDMGWFAKDFEYVLKDSFGPELYAGFEVTTDPTVICEEHDPESNQTPNPAAIPDKVDNVNHPSHYKSKNGLECIDVIDAATEGLTGIEATHTGQVIKYIWRWKKKNGVEDLKKAKWYLDRLINHLEKENDNNE